MQTTEQRLERLEKHNKRLTAALTVMAVAMAAVVTMAATGEKDSYFDTVVARSIYVKNDAGEYVIVLGATDDGHGLVGTLSAQGKDLVTLSSARGHGTVATFQPNGKELVDLGVNDNGGLVYVNNKTGETIAEMGADEYGNGVVGAYNRKGIGPQLKPGP